MGEQLIPSIKPRPSSMDRSMSCPGSLYPEPGEALVKFHDEGGVAAIGSAAHDALSCVMLSQPVDAAAIAAKWKVKQDDLGFLISGCYRFAAMLKDEYDVQEWLIEQRLEMKSPFPMKGRVDIGGVIVDGKTLIVSDYKSGRASTSCEHQIHSYAEMIRQKFPDVETVIGLVLWARDEEVQVFTWSQDDMIQWTIDVVETIYNWDGVTYAIGEHCTYCQRQFSCPARGKALMATQEMMLDTKPEVTHLVGEDFAKAWAASISIPGMVKRWREMQRQRILASGPIDMGKGKVLALTEKNTAPDTDAFKASKVLKAGYNFTDEDVLACCKLSKADVETTVGDRAPKGKKGAHKKEVIGSLVQYGAIIPKTAQTLKIVDAPTEKGE